MGSGIESIAINMTSNDFESFCNGMSIVWTLRAINCKCEHSRKRKMQRVKFWDEAWGDYSHLCKVEE